MKKEVKDEALLTPVPVVMVSCKDGEKEDIVTVAWTGIISSNPPTVYISLRKERYSYGIIEKTKEFVINIPDEKLVKQVDFCGTRTGKDVDKFKETGLTKLNSKYVNAPSIAEAKVNLECKVKEIKNEGSHEMIIAEVINVLADEDVLNLNGTVNLSKVKALTYMGPEYFVSDRFVASRGISLK